MKQEEPKIIDLFAGAGGLTEGFVKAGFSAVAHVEMDSHACKTLETRCAYHYLRKVNKLQIYEDYLKGEISRDYLLSNIPNNILDSIFNVEISDSTIEILFSKIDARLDGSTIDLIIGGPPCQAYSLLGRHKKEMEDDPRTRLYLQYGRFLEHYQPRGFVFENVPGLLSAKRGEHFKNLQDYFLSLGYVVRYKMLNSSNYGVPQARKRLILVGWKKDCDLGYPIFQEFGYQSTVRDVFSDLPLLQAGDCVNYASYTSAVSNYLQKSGIRDLESLGVSQNITRPLNEKDTALYKYFISSWTEQHKRVKYSDVPAFLKTQKNVVSFVDRYKVVDLDAPSHTVIAHLSKDGHYYIHPSLSQCRSISVREAARLQSFPDSYYFEGDRSSKFKQIGNAVPPLMSYAIACGIKDIL